MKYKVGDLVRVLGIDVIDDWERDGTPKGSLKTPYPIGKIAVVTEISPFDPNNTEYIVRARIEGESNYVYRESDIELVFDTGF